jgi:hypothetical protein
MFIIDLLFVMVLFLVFDLAMHVISSLLCHLFSGTVNDGVTFFLCLHCVEVICLIYKCSNFIFLWVA